MPFRHDPHEDRLYEHGWRNRSFNARQPSGDAPRRAGRPFGWARRRDVEDTYSQEAAPQGRGRYDRTGEQEYARGLDEFEANREYGARGRYAGDPAPRWELDEGGVQFGRPRDRRADMPGPHRGRGPRGYQRSDERIREDVCECLTEADDVDASGVEVQVTAGTVTLTGTIEDRYAKRRAEDLADAVSGVREVQNHLRLQPLADEP